MVDLAPYADLTITLTRPAKDQYWVELRFTQADGQAEQAPASGPVRFDFDALRGTHYEPDEYGRLLKEALFSSQALREFFLQSLPAAGAAQKDLRLRVHIDRSALELHDLRWETLRDPDDQDFLALKAGLPFSRFLYSADWRQVELRQKGSLRALVVVANPTNLKQGVTLSGQRLAEVDIADEVGRAQAALKGIRTVDVLESRENEPGRVTLQVLQDELDRGYDILYLVCHGALLPEDPEEKTSPLRPFLVLEKGNGTYERVDAKLLVEFIRNQHPERRPRLVVLASCQSGGQGKVPGAEKDPGEADQAERSYDRGALAAIGPRLVEAGVPAVLAMQDNIKMKTVEEFIPHFFRELLSHGQVDRAMAGARNQIRQRQDWWAPVLYTRLKDGRLFLEEVRAPRRFKSPKFPENYENNRGAMLDLVLSTHFDRNQNSSWDKNNLIELDMVTMPDAIEQPIESEDVPSWKTILEQLDEAKGKLLILGKPGSGKTTKLRELCYQAFERADKAGENAQQPIPVLLDLETWKPDQQKKPEQVFFNWLVCEINRVYGGLPLKYIYPFIENDDLLLLLDGFDKIQEDREREACLQAIIAFRAEHYVSIAVASRVQEYWDLTICFNFPKAVLIQPLTIAKVEEFIGADDVGLTSSIVQALKHSPNLRKFVDTPLNLGILVKVYRDASEEDLKALEKTGKYTQHLLNIYITKMYERQQAISERQSPSQDYKQEKILKWLSWLSLKMRERGDPRFFIEDIQPSWLPYSEIKKWFLFRLIFGLVSGLIFGLLIGLFYGLTWGLVGGVLIGVIFGWAGIHNDSKPSHNIIWPWKEILKIEPAFIVLLLFAAYCYSPRPFDEWIQIMGLWILALLSFGILMSVLAKIVLTVFRDRSAYEKRSNPGEGIKFSIKNDLRLGLLFGLLLCVIFGLVLGRVGYGINGSYRDLIFWPIIGLILGLIVGTSRSDGFFVLKHFVSRWLLILDGYLPLDLMTFLTYCTKLGFLHREGGSYSFSSKLLMEHFAEMPKTGETETT